MSPWDKLLERPHSRGHFVQLYETGGSSSTDNVSWYLCEGLKQGDGALVIAAPEHFRQFCRGIEQLGGGAQPALRSRQLVFLDAAETLARFMAGVEPDWRSFEHTIHAAMQQVRPKRGQAGLRAYGEMVGILWRARQFSAAVRVEQFWNKLLEERSFSLFCAYGLDAFGREFHVSALDGILCTHTHLIPAAPGGALQIALHRAMDEVLGPDSERLKNQIRFDDHPSWAALPTAEATILWLRVNLPARAGPVIARARELFQGPSPAGAPAV